jgi:hypothetical protein
MIITYKNRKGNMGRLINIFLFILISGKISLNAYDRIFFIPGIKYSVILGKEKRQNIFGVDLSIVFERENDRGLWGINSTLELWGEHKKITMGYEYLNDKEILHGISFGPAISLDNSQYRYGIYINAFIVMPLILSWQYTLLIKREDIPEFGIFIKSPLKIGGEKDDYFDLDISIPPSFNPLGM